MKKLILATSFLSILILFNSDIFSKGIKFKNKSGWTVKIALTIPARQDVIKNIKNNKEYHYDSLKNPVLISITPSCPIEPTILDEKTKHKIRTWDASREIIIKSEIDALSGSNFVTVEIAKETLKNGRTRLNAEFDKGALENPAEGKKILYNNEWQKGN